MLQYTAVSVRHQPLSRGGGNDRHALLSFGLAVKSRKGRMGSGPE